MPASGQNSPLLEALTGNFNVGVIGGCTRGSNAYVSIVVCRRRHGRGGRASGWSDTAFRSTNSASAIRLSPPGTTAAVGGLIVFAIGAVVGHLQRSPRCWRRARRHSASRPTRSVRTAVPARMPPPAPSRIPFPPRRNRRTENPRHRLRARRSGRQRASSVRRRADAAQSGRAGAAVEQFEVQEHDDVSLSPQRANSSACA